MTFTARSRPASNRFTACAALLACLLAAMPALAKDSDRNQKVDILSQSFTGSQEQGKMTLLRDVVITQGTLKATGDKAIAYFDKDYQVSRVVIDGNPGHLQQQLDGDGGMMLAHANSIDYQVAKDTAILSGNAYVKQAGRGEFQGDRLVYNTKTGKITGQSNGDNRVHLILAPRKPPSGKN